MQRDYITSSEVAAEAVRAARDELDAARRVRVVMRGAANQCMVWPAAMGDDPMQREKVGPANSE